MLKFFSLSALYKIIPEAIAILFISSNNTELISIPFKCLLLLSYSLSTRLAWQSAIIIHGLGHTATIAIADKDLSIFNPTNILEDRPIVTILKSLLPFHPIFFPLFSESPSLTTGKPTNIRIKASGGILFNLLVAIIFSSYSQNIFSQTLIVANLLIAVSSLSDIGALFTGLADCFYCGNFGFIARRKPNDGGRLLPVRMLDLARQMGQETEMRGEQAGGVLVAGRKGDRQVFVGEKIVNRKRSNLTKSLETAFAPIRREAISAGVRPFESTAMGVWHYRYATAGTAPSKVETHWHQWMTAREERVWQYIDREWICQTKNVNHRITHNGDFDAWHIFGKDVDYQTLGLWLEKVLRTPNATKGDSPKIAGMMDLLVTQGMWYPSVRLAYQQAISAKFKNVDGKNTANATNIVPSERELNTWAEICERVFNEELCSLKPADPLTTTPAALKSSTRLQENLLKAFNSYSSMTEWSPSQTAAFIKFVLKAFFENDLYRATQIFVAQARGTFGLVTVSTLDESKLVLTAKGQPITIGFNWSQGYMVYASEPAAVDRVLVDKPQSFRLDLNAEYGEIARVGASDLSVYSLSKGQELTALELKDRWISMTEYPYLPYMRLNKTSTCDPVADDIKSIPQILHQIKTIWQDSTSLNRQSADYLVQLLTTKVHRFEKRQGVMFQAGLIDCVKKLPTVDLVITGEENSLWLGEKFAQDLKVVFPFLNIVAISANQVLRQLERFDELCLDKDSLILAISQSGQTFSTVQVISAFDRLSSRGVIGEVFIFTGELTSFINSIQGKGRLTTTANSLQENYSNYRHCNLDNRHNETTVLKDTPSDIATTERISAKCCPENSAPVPTMECPTQGDKATIRRLSCQVGSRSSNGETESPLSSLANLETPVTDYLHNGLPRIFVNGSGRRTSEPSTVAVAAAGQTLTELLFYIAKQMRQKFPDSRPYGMSLTTESLKVLTMLKEDFINKNVMQIVGFTDLGNPIKSTVRQRLIKGGRNWGNHVIETPLAWIIHALYILISVGWMIPLVRTILRLFFTTFSLPQNIWELIAPIVTLADIAVYIFGAWLWTLLIRYFQGRQLLARMGKRTLIIADVSWVNQLLESYISKLFSLSYGIASLEVHGSNTQNHLLHSFGHRVVRGTLVWLGVPDGRHSRQQQKVESAAIRTGTQVNGVRNFNVGAEIIAVGRNPAIADRGFNNALLLSNNDDSIYAKNLPDAEQKEQIEVLKESCFVAFERLLASYVFFWALAKKVANFPILKYQFWKSQSRTKVMTTASPITGLDEDTFNKWSNSFSGFLHDESQ